MYVCRVLMCLKILTCVIPLILLCISVTNFIVPNNAQDINTACVLLRSVVALCCCALYEYETSTCKTAHKIIVIIHRDVTII